MRRYCVLFICALLCSCASAQVTLSVTATDPDSPATLGSWEHLALRIPYSSDRPIRVRANAYLGDQRVTSITGGSPLYQPGQGDAFFWLSFTNAQRVDRITVTAEDNRTQKALAETSIPVDINWTGIRNPTPRTPAAWAQEMQAAQNRASDAAAREYMNRPVGAFWSMFFFVLMWSIPGYFILQIVLLQKFQGKWRTAAALPLLPMLLVLAQAIFAFFNGSNLFPILLIFTSFPALLYLLAVVGVRRMRAAQA